MNQYLTASFILIVSFIILASLVSPRINANVNKTSLHDADYSAFILINNSHYRPFDGLMILLTQYGREVVWTLASILLLIFGGSKGRNTVVIIAMTMIVLIIIGQIAKEAVGRPRPIMYDNSSSLVAPDKEFAFPSGHALLVSSGAAVMLALFRDSHKRQIISIGLTIEAALVCFSRVYVGGHYPLDVIGGILLGVGVAFIFVALVKPISYQILEPISKALKR